MDINNTSIHKNNFLSIEQLANQIGSKAAKSTDSTDRVMTKDGLSFKEILDRKSNSDTLKFSKHAMLRLSDRGITLSGDQLDRLENGTEKAEMKGIKDSLVIVDNLAFIVNIPNKTVITAIDSSQADDNIFTNINGAVIM